MKGAGPYGEWSHISLAGWIGFLPLLEDNNSIQNALDLSLIISLLSDLILHYPHARNLQPRTSVGQRAQSWQLQDEASRAKMVSMLKDRFQAWD